MKTAIFGLAFLLACAGTLQSQAPRVESRLEVLTVATGEREVVWSAETHFEAPNWSRDGQSLLFNQGGRMLRPAARVPDAPAPGHRHGHAMQQRPRPLARREVAGDQPLPWQGVVDLRRRRHRR